MSWYPRPTFDNMFVCLATLYRGVLFPSPVLRHFWMILSSSKETEIDLLPTSSNKICTLNITFINPRSVSQVILIVKVHSMTIMWHLSPQRHGLCFSPPFHFVFIVTPCQEQTCLDFILKLYTFPCKFSWALSKPIYIWNSTKKQILTWPSQFLPSLSFSPKNNTSSELAKLLCPVVDARHKNYWLELIAMYIKGSKSKNI